MCIPSTCGITNEEAKHQMMMDERERENEATFKDHNTHTYNADQNETVTIRRQSLAFSPPCEYDPGTQWSGLSWLYNESIDHITSHVNFGVELPPAKKIQ